MLALCSVALAIPPFAVDPGGHADPGDFRVTTFATGLSYPTSMQQLADGSLLVGTSVGSTFFASTGKLVRLVDADADGVADGPPTELATGLPAGITSVRVAGELVFVTSSEGKTLSVLRLGPTPADPLVRVDAITFAFPANQWHLSYALAVREVGPGVVDLVFNLGSRFNDVNDAATVTASGLVTGALAAESIWAVTVTDDGTDVVASDLRQLASGLRNAAGITFAENGDLWFEDNGIDGPGSSALSTDELDRIAAADLGGVVEDFGFASTYTTYRTGVEVGSAGIPPEVVFQPIPMPNGSENEGAVEIAMAPAGFPDGLNAGLFVGFHGKFNAGGVTNEENPLAYADPATGEIFHFVSNDEPAIGHPNGLLATADSLFVADVSSGSMFSSAATGNVYQITWDPASNPCPGDGDDDGDGICNTLDLCPDDPDDDLDDDGICAVDGDCDDTDPAIHPGAAEACDGVDQDCDGSLNHVTVCAATCGDGVVDALAPATLPACANTSFTKIDTVAKLNAWRANPVTGANITAPLVLSGDVELLTACDVKTSATASLSGAGSLFVAGRSLTFAGPLQAAGPILLRGSTRVTTNATATIAAASLAIESPTVSVAGDASGAGLCADGGATTLAADASWSLGGRDAVLRATGTVTVAGDLAGPGTLDVRGPGAGRFSQPATSSLAELDEVSIVVGGTADFAGQISDAGSLAVDASQLTVRSTAAWTALECSVGLP